MYELHFEIAGLPKLANELLRRNWRTVNGEKNRIRKLVWAMVCDKKPEKPLERSRLTITRRSSAYPDPDNLVGGCKYVIDALRHEGIIADDTAANVELDCRWEKAKPRAGSVLVSVVEVIR